MEFLWTRGLEPPHFPALEDDIETDVLVIGGGMAGILCALRLQQAGIRCVVAEARTVGSGITKGTTAVLTAQHDTLYTELVKNSGEAAAGQYLQANLEALRQFGRLQEQFPCDYEKADSIMYDCSDRHKMEQEAAVVRALGFDAQFIRQPPLPFPVAGAVLYPGMAQLHPLKLLYGAARTLTVYENTFVCRLEGTTAVTRHGRIRAARIVVASHFPFLNSHGKYYMKLYQKRSYVAAYTNAVPLGCTLADAAENGVYLRSYGDYLLIGGGDHRTGVKSDGFAPVRSFARQYFPQAREAFCWVNQDCMSLDGIPYIGPYSPGTPGVFVAAGFNEWGMTGSMVAAGLLCALLQGESSPFAPTFAPDRRMRKRPLVSNLGAALASFAVPTAPRCPHLGCALRRNHREHTWECPCHGSRFTADGRLIDGPAMQDCRGS